jgi:hypothetical protein
MSATGQTQKSGCSTGRSALPSITDIVSQSLSGPKSATSRHRHLIDHLASAQQERSERVVDDVKCIRATTKR